MTSVAPRQPVKLQARLTVPRGSRRRQAIDAAARVFARSGYHGAGTRAIAEVLGIKVPSLYTYFKSKDDALEQVCLVGIEQPLAYLREARVSETGFRERIHRFFRSHRENLHRNSHYVSVFMNERRYLTAEGTARLNAFARDVKIEFEAIFADAMAEGTMDTAIDPRMARLIAIGVLRNITQFHLEGPIRDFDRFVYNSAEHLLRGLAPPQQAGAAWL